MQALSPLEALPLDSTMADAAAEDATERAPALDALERSLLNDFQHGFPLTARPFADIARRLGADEDEVIERYKKLAALGVISRIGPVVKPRRVGVSTLVAMAVPAEDLARVARIVNEYAEVNHNYEREHQFTLWFVLTAARRERIDAIIEELRERAGYQLLDLPMLKSWRIDLGFPLWC